MVVLHNSLLTFLLSKARQAKTEHMEMKILQPIFDILVVLTKNELTKICNELGISIILVYIYIYFFFQLLKTVIGQRFLRQDNQLKKKIHTQH